MGVGPTGAHLALMAKRKGADFSRTLTIGRQRLFLYEGNRNLFARHGYKIDDAVISAVYAEDYAESFFRTLGAGTVDSMDASPYEGATLIHDLNLPVAGSMHGRFTAVCDYGTLEHIFNVPVALKNCIDMIEVGGHYMSITPCNNMMGHGFYQFSPEFFFNFLSCNGFEDIYLFIGLWSYDKFFAVTDPRVFGGRVELLNDEASQICVLAKKVRSIPDIVTPIQSDYSDAIWKGINPNRTTHVRAEQDIPAPIVAMARANKESSDRLLKAVKDVDLRLAKGFENAHMYRVVDLATV